LAWKNKTQEATLHWKESVLQAVLREIRLQCAGFIIHDFDRLACIAWSSPYPSSQGQLCPA